MAAFSTNEGYASARTRKAALFDPLLNAHAFDRQRLLTDRSAYVSFLEVQLERVTAACLTTQGFSDRIEQLQNQISALEAKIRGGGRLEVTGAAVCTCQSTCARMADDALAAVQSMDEKFERTEQNFDRRLSEISSKMIDLLRQVITKQRDMQFKISGNLDISDPARRLGSLVQDNQPPTPTQSLSALAEPQTPVIVTPSATLRLSGDVVPRKSTTPKAEIPGARIRATSAPGAAAAQARRRRAVDDLQRELELLEQDGN